MRAARPERRAWALAFSVVLSVGPVGLAGCRGSGRPPPPATLASPRTLASPLTPTSPPTTVTTTQPPYPVDTATLAFVDPSRPTVSRGVRISSQRALPTVVWYPAVAGHWPLVLFAPGFRVGPSTYDTLLHSWAAGGYVVAAPEFPLEDQAVAGSALDESDLVNEPADVGFVRACLLATSDPLAGRIEPGLVGVAGHSDGAEVALALAQGGDPTIGAAIVMSGQPVAGRQAANPPLLVVQGDHDTTNPPALGDAVFAHAGPPRFLLTLIGADHLAPYLGGSPWEPIVGAATLDFLDRYLARRVDGDEALKAAGTRPGLATLS